MISRNGKAFASILVSMLCMATISFAQKAEQSPTTAKKVDSVVFKQTELKTVLKNLGRNLKLNVVFDDSVRNPLLDIELNDVTIGAALKITLIQQGLDARLIEDNTIIVFYDAPSAPRRYMEFKRWTWQAEEKK